MMILRTLTFLSIITFHSLECQEAASIREELSGSTDTGQSSLSSDVMPNPKDIPLNPDQEVEREMMLELKKWQSMLLEYKKMKKSVSSDERIIYKRKMSFLEEKYEIIKKASCEKPLQKASYKEGEGVIKKSSTFLSKEEKKYCLQDLIMTKKKMLKAQLDNQLELLELDYLLLQKDLLDSYKLKSQKLLEVEKKL